MDMQFRAPEAFRVAADLGEASVMVLARAEATTRFWGNALRTAVRAHASGRPGPRAQTGDYRRSITLDVDHGDFGVQARVGTNAPQARRLEFGFVGADALGRVYNQPPYPHFGPALDEIEPRYVDALDGIAASVTRGGGR